MFYISYLPNKLLLIMTFYGAKNNHRNHTCAEIIKKKSYSGSFLYKPQWLVLVISANLARVSV